MNEPIYIPKRGARVNEQIMNIMDEKINNKTIRIEFRLGDVIQLYNKKNDLNDFVFNGDYKIIAAKFYKFDLPSLGYGVAGGTYIVSEVKLSDTHKTFKRNEYRLEYNDWVKKCWNSTNWNQPKWVIANARFTGIEGLNAESFVLEERASFFFNSGNGYYYPIKDERGPQTIFTLQSTLSKKNITLFDIQLYYYYKCHK